MSNSQLNLVWMDLEMTGLQPDQDRILEIAVLVTDADLNIIAEGPELVIHQSEEQLALMDEWNQRTHGGSGLIARVQASVVREAAAEQQLLEFLKTWVKPGASPLCGNSIGQDRRFLARWMPELEQYFHYRNLDVSTLKELARRWAPGVLASLTKGSKHQALDDIRDSIAELRHYRAHLFREEYRGTE
jgi:oligoribonuclease